MSKEQNKDNYLNLTEAEQRLEAEWENEVKERNRKFYEAEERKQAEYELEMKKLMNKIHAEDYEEKKQERDRLVEIEKQKAINKIEADFESEGIKSTQSEKLNEAYRNLLSDIKFDD